jgi:PAS domain S-box-containing protein
MFDGVWLLGADGRTTYVNRAIAVLLGTTRSAMRNRPLVDFVDADLRSGVEAFLDRQRTHAGERMELSLRRLDGRDLPVLLAGSPIHHEEVYVGVMLNVSDVSGKRSIDAQIMQNQRLEAIGQFAGGIAPDFNNLLTSIHGFAELALEQLVEADPARKDLDQVLLGAERASAITSKLLAFTRRQVLLPTDVDPGGVVSGLVPMLKPLLGDGIELTVEIAADHAWVVVDATQLEQVIVNLAINARDAMPTGGTLAIGVHDLTPVDPDRPDADLTAGPFVRITVQDSGFGMDEETQARMFDPFFSTKEGKGTGLGLSTVFGIVAQSGGQISVETAPGEGATFHIDLPLVEVTNERVSAIADQGRRDSPPAVRRDGVVLVVDDDEPVRELCRRTLESIGYTVLTAGSGTEAIAVARAWDGAIDVLFTDVVMPGLHGSELARAIRAERPDIGVVLTSGYAAELVDRPRNLREFGEFLPKPFKVPALQLAVSRAAGGGAQPPPPRRTNLPEA